MAEGLDDLTRFPHLFAELLRRGYTDADLRKIAGENMLRAMRAMSEERRSWQRPNHRRARVIQNLTRDDRLWSRAHRVGAYYGIPSVRSRSQGTAESGIPDGVALSGEVVACYRLGR